MEKSFHLLLAAVILIAGFGCAGKTARPKPGDEAAAQAQVDEAVVLLKEALAEDEDGSFRQLLALAKGLMFIPAIGDVSFLFSVGGGYGLVMAKTDAGWTGPVFLYKGTFGFGLQAGISKQTGIMIFMDPEDVRYLLETGAILRGQARAVVLNAELEANQTPEFFNDNDVYFVGDHTGLYAGIAIDGGGFTNRLNYNEAYSGVKGGAPSFILFDEQALPEGAHDLRALLVKTGDDAAEANRKAAEHLAKQKDGTEVPSD